LGPRRCLARNTCGFRSVTSKHTSQSSYFRFKIYVNTNMFDDDLEARTSLDILRRLLFAWCTYILFGEQFVVDPAGASQRLQKPFRTPGEFQSFLFRTQSAPVASSQQSHCRKNASASNNTNAKTQTNPNNNTNAKFYGNTCSGYLPSITAKRTWQFFSMIFC
jgi:hypothetical protein